MVLAVAHADCSVVVHIRRVRQVAQAENGRPRIGHRVHVASINGAALHMRPVVAIALERVRVILGRG